MNPQYRVESVSLSVDDSKKTLVEFAAPIIFGEGPFQEIMSKILEKRPMFFLQADLKKRGEKDTASNLRLKKDLTTNNRVVDNFAMMFEMIDKRNPITITSYPRSVRYYSAKIEEDGKILINDSRTNSVDPEFTELLQTFLEKYNIDLTKYREACSGAKYNTYLADLISFLLVIKSFINPVIFEEKFMKIDVALNDLDDIPEKNGKVWSPKRDFKYLYFKESREEEENAKRFHVPKNDTICHIYDMMKNILMDVENREKKQVRECLCDSFSYDRFSDYWCNDIDDGLTILMIYHCFNYGDLSKEELRIKEYLSRVIQSVF